MKTPHPEWATKYRTKGTELRLFGNKYYLYGYKTIYDRIKKKPKKISGKMIGRITQEGGLVKGDKEKLRLKLAKEKTISVGHTREFGMSNYILTLLSDFYKQLEFCFPDQWQQIVLLAYTRLVFQSPIKRMPFHIANSWFLEHWGMKQMSEKTISLLLRSLGQNRQKAVEYMRFFVQKGEYILADTTHILSKSKLIELSHKGYNNKMDYEPQVNLMYIYSTNSCMPVFYRLHAGNIREIKAFKLTLKESGVANAIIIGDKGFYSEENVLTLEKEKIQFILPLHRNNKLIDYSVIVDGTIKKTKNYFEHEQRFIWFSQLKMKDGKRCILFLDEKLREKEERDYLKRIQSYPEEYNIKKFREKLSSFGTLAVLVSKIQKNPRQIYQAYKERMDIETMFDALKNIIDNDSTYMQNEDALQGWMFINHIALQWYQHMYLKIAAQNLTAKYSVKDLMIQLREIRKVQINNQWYDAEITNATQTLLAKLKM